MNFESETTTILEGGGRVPWGSGRPSPPAADRRDSEGAEAARAAAPGRVPETAAAGDVTVVGPNPQPNHREVCDRLRASACSQPDPLRGGVRLILAEQAEIAAGLGAIVVQAIREAADGPDPAGEIAANLPLLQVQHGAARNAFQLFRLDLAFERIDEAAARAGAAARNTSTGMEVGRRGVGDARSDDP